MSPMAGTVRSLNPTRLTISAVSRKVRTKNLKTFSKSFLEPLTPYKATHSKLVRHQSSYQKMQGRHLFEPEAGYQLARKPNGTIQRLFEIAQPTSPP